MLKSDQKRQVTSFCLRITYGGLKDLLEIKTGTLLKGA